MREIVWKPFDISKYVDYERDGYKYEGYSEGVYQTWKTGHGHRTWSKTVGSWEHQIIETDMWASIDYMVRYPGDDGVVRFASNYLIHVGRITWKRRKAGERWIRHREDGPAFIRINQHEKLAKTEWWINGIDISKDVRPWLKSMAMPVFYNWTDEHKVLFKLTFA